jgi:hypothetical protein
MSIRAKHLWPAFFLLGACLCLYAGHLSYSDLPPADTGETGLVVEQSKHTLQGAQPGQDYSIPYVFINRTPRPIRIVGLAPT